MASFMDCFGPDPYMGLSNAGQVYPWNSAPGASPQLEASSTSGKRTDSAGCVVEEATPQGTTRQGSATLWTGCTRPAGG
jgi:hypothetical protein